MKCIKCGAQIEHGKRFCGSCGAQAPAGGYDFNGDLWNGGVAQMEQIKQAEQAMQMSQARSTGSMREGTVALILGIAPWVMVPLGFMLMLIGEDMMSDFVYFLSLFLLVGSIVVAILAMVIGGMRYRETGSVRARSGKMSALVFLIVVLVFFAIAVIGALIVDSQRSVKIRW
ncbi:MAG: zinc ribbon domain-containing protein [Lachnospiraceae bacterium]|nr:zinc ribbon domain-containing protein [Lachnospiraceae bacterium]